MIIKKKFSNYKMFLNVHNEKQNTVNLLIINEIKYDSNKKKIIYKKTKSIEKKSVKML